MMWLVLSLALIVVLYWRTLSYKNLIDDAVPMKDYLYVVPQTTPAPDFHLQKPPLRNRIWAITIHCLNTVMVYLILGGKAALLFSVFPVAVNNVAWITGSYYSTTTFLTLASYYFLTKTVWFVGVPLAMAFFAAALNSTVATISFPFVFLFSNPIGLTLLFPLGMFLKGKRFTVGKKIREGNGYVPANILPDIFTPRRLVMMTKVVGLYLYTTLVPLKLCFFRKFGEMYRINPEERKFMDSFNKYFWGSVALITAFVGTAIYLDKLFWAMWFLVLISAFSQYKMLGQFFAERYIYPAAIGVIALLACLPDPAYWILFGAYIIRTHFFIPVFETNQTLYENGIRMSPKEGINYCNLTDWHFTVVPDPALWGWYAQKNMQVDPLDYKPHINMASLWRTLGNFPAALEQGKLAKQKAEGRCYPHTMKIIDEQLSRTEQMLQQQQAVVHAHE